MKRQTEDHKRSKREIIKLSKINGEFLIETRVVRRQWDDILKILKLKKNKKYCTSGKRQK
jgi:hypothetical protein